jgi:RNA polymerase sigma-70 factor (ECF subfamily)
LSEAPHAPPGPGRFDSRANPETPGAETSLPLEDLALAGRARAGDGEAILAFLGRMTCVHRMISQRNTRLGRPFGPEELEDIAQDVMITVWRKLDGFEGRGSLEGWVVRFVHLELLYRLRKKDRLPRLLEDLPGERAPEPEETALDEELECGALHEALDRLGPPESEILRLRHFDELPFAEIAQRLGDGLATTKTRYYRGLKKVRDMLGEGYLARVTGEPA